MGQGGVATSAIPYNIITTHFIEGRRTGSSWTHQRPALTKFSKFFVYFCATDKLIQLSINEALVNPIGKNDFLWFWCINLHVFPAANSFQEHYSIAINIYFYWYWSSLVTFRRHVTLVPLINDKVLIWSGTNNFASPKSEIFALQNSSIRMFWGFMSQWRIGGSHSSWRYRIPLATSNAILTLWFQ